MTDDQVTLAHVYQQETAALLVYLCGHACCFFDAVCQVSVSVSCQHLPQVLSCGSVAVLSCQVPQAGHLV